MRILAIIVSVVASSVWHALAGFTPSIVKDVSDVCPKSPAMMHAGCQATIEFVNPCSEVQTEIKNRVSGANGWTDPHNNGTYTLIGETAELFELSRLTGDGKYTDLINFAFGSSESGCSVQACSEGQVYSIGDAGTNFCNIHDLYCTEEGCNPINANLKYDESVGKCTNASPSKCIV